MTTYEFIRCIYEGESEGSRPTILRLSFRSFALPAFDRHVVSPAPRPITETDSRTFLAVKKAEISAATYDTVTVSFNTGPNAMNYPCVT